MDIQNIVAIVAIIGSAVSLFFNFKGNTQGKIAVLENEVDTLKETLEQHTKALNRKLEVKDLLAMKAKTESNKEAISDLKSSKNSLYKGLNELKKDVGSHMVKVENRVTELKTMLETLIKLQEEKK